MPTHQLTLAPAAKADLKDIYQYGLRQWGQAQSDRYLDALKGIFWALTEQPLMGTERPKLLTRIRSLPAESHVLFYRVTDRNVEIIRVLHSRQDPIRHLK
ncbi:type II toxin-antitoxin system RelE/ParE family toxin [uncultured Thalassolituus sp.]|uniref:type II toxin-antitoxin system RelE/ParE family toxin n=1 Tax=uncultured Thalassolituus sp. TaxID=285273 RepID=UPI00243D2BE2